MGGYGFVSVRMRGKAPRNDPIYEAYWPLGVSQPLTHESFTTLDLAETSALDCTWHVVPFEDESTIVLVACLSVVKEPGGGDFA